ncbi:MAG: phospholipase D family protein [Simkaniaceae bacterium]|nr:MAG: phospholipase D family protein [Simkaniaceae bacterium]
MVHALEKITPSDTRAVEEILDQYKTVELFRDLGSGMEVRATVLVLKAELYFHDAKLLTPQRVVAREELRAPIIEESDGEEDIFYDCVDYFEDEIQGRVGIQEKQQLVQKAAEVGALFMRDHLLPATLKEGALDHDLIVERVEEWFEKFLPTLFFDQGVATSQQKADLGLTCEVIGSMTRFIKDYNEMRFAIEKNEGRCSPHEMHGKVYHEMSKGKASEQEILFNFCQNLLSLYEAQQGKTIGEDKKNHIALSTTKVLDAMIDTVLSPEFSKLLVLGFLDDDKIMGEIQELQPRETSETDAGEVPAELQLELTKLINELIDFGNPRFGSWIATSMLKTHFMRTDSPGIMKSTLRFGMRMLSKPLFKDEIGAFLKEAFSVQKTGGASNEEWVKTATLGVSVIRRYGWTETGACKLGSVQEKANIPEALFQKITKIVHESGPKETSRMLSVTSWVMPSVHTFGKSLTENLYALSQSREMMRTYTVRYLIGGVLSVEVQRQRALISPRISTLPVLPQEGVPEQLGQRMSLLVGDYLRGYVKELYLKESPLVTNVIDLSVTMVQGFLPDMVALSARENKTLSKAKQQMVVDFYGALGPFLKDYALAIQEAKKDPAYPVFAVQRKEERLIITALERVRGAPVKISDRDVNKKLEAISDLLIRSQCHGVAPLQAQLIRSTAFVLPELLKGGIDLFFSPDMMNTFLLNCIESFDMDMPVDPEHQYQSWDTEVLSRWNDSLFSLINGMAEIGEPQGKMREITETVLGVGDGARQNLGSLLTRFSYGPSPLLSPAATLQTISILEKALFTQEKKARITNVFNDSLRGKREEALKSALQGLLTRPLPMDSIHSVTRGWMGETVQKVMNFGQTAASHLGSLSSILSSEQGSSVEGPLIRAFKHEVDQRTSGALSFLLPGSERSLSSSFHGFLYEKLTEVMSGSDVVQSLTLGNPVIKFLDNACSNVMSFFKSKALMRTFVYNYVLTPQFFNHLVQNLDKEKAISQSSLAGNLPGSLFLDMTAFSWVLPGPMRNPALLDAPKMDQGFRWNPPLPSVDLEGCFGSVSRQLLESERLFEASKASPTLNALFGKLNSWEKEGKLESDLIQELVNNLENPERFYEGVKQLLNTLEQSNILTRDERVALKGEAKKGEFPFVFRYLDLMMSEKTPVIIALFGQHPHESLRETFLERAVGEVNGSVIQKMEPLHLGKAFEKWLTPYLKEGETVRRQMQAVLEILANDKKRDSIAEKFAYLLGETQKYIPLRGTDALLLAEVLEGFKTAEDPLSNAMQYFSIHETVQYWESKTEKIHQVLGHLRLENPTAFPVMETIDPQLKGYYQKLGTVLSEILTPPFSDKLKLVYSEQFLCRYRSLAAAIAPSEGEKVLHSCSVAITAHSMSGNEHKLQLLGAAKKSIVMSGCYFGGEIFGRSLAVIEGNLEANPELDVKLIGSDYMLTGENKVQIRALEEKYPRRFLMQITPEVQLYSSPISDRTSYRTNHSKVLVIDYGKYFEMGGSGLVDKWATTGMEGIQSPSGRPTEPLAFRDADFIFKSEDKHGIGYALYLELTSLFPVWGAKDVKGRIQASFHPRFHHVVRPYCDLARAANIDDHGERNMSEEVTFYSTGPDSTENNLLKDLIRDIDSAQEIIHIQHMYFHPTEELLDSLKRAAGRGIAIEICTNRTGPDMPFTHEFFVELSRSNWKSLYGGKANPKIKIYEFNVANTTYHKKIVMIDKRTIYLGSSNLGEKSLNMNDHEINLRVSSRDLGRAVYEEFQRDTGPNFESMAESSDSHHIQEGLHRFAQSSDRNVQALAAASLSQVQFLAAKGCPLISIKSWAYGAIIGNFTAEPTFFIGFQNIGHTDRESFKAVMGIDELQGKISSNSFIIREILMIAKSFSNQAIPLRNPNDQKFMEEFSFNLEAGKDPRTSSANAYLAISRSLLSESMQVFAEGLSNTILEVEQHSEKRKGLCREVPASEAPHMPIDGAALAQVQSSLLQRWL